MILQASANDWPAITWAAVQASSDIILPVRSRWALPTTAEHQTGASAARPAHPFLVQLRITSGRNIFIIDAGGVAVGVGVDVDPGGEVGVCVAVQVGVAVAWDVAVAVAVGVAVAWDVAVGVGVGTWPAFWSLPQKPPRRV